MTGDLSPSCVDVGLEGDLAVYDQASGIKRVFKVDRVFDQNVDQTVVYEDTQPLIRSVLDGKCWTVTAVRLYAACSAVIRYQVAHAAFQHSCVCAPFNQRHLSATLTSHACLFLLQATTCASLPTARQAVARRTQCLARTLRNWQAVASTTAHWMICLASGTAGPR